MPTPRLACPVLLATLLLAGCDPTDACPQAEFPGIVLQVRDSTTGAGLAPGALIIAAEAGGVTADTLAWLPNDDSVFVSGLHGRHGTFDLTVSVAGYLPWRNPALVISQDACGNTVPVETVAWLNPL